MKEVSKLRERVKIYAPPEGTQALAVWDYAFVATVWADVRELTAREQMRSGVDLQSGKLTVLIRYRDGLSEDCVLFWRERYYGIDSISADRSKGEIILGCSYSPLNGNGRFET